jgi:SNF2 family DNA or RNA helicase
MPVPASLTSTNAPFPPPPPGHKVLLFCTMTRLLDLLEEYLEWRGLEYLRMDGATGNEERGKLVERFNDPGGGAGLCFMPLYLGKMSSMPTQHRMCWLVRC